MGNISVNKLGGLSLMLGPVLALVFYLTAPGSLLNDPVDPTDSAAAIGAIVSNAPMAHVAGFFTILGLIMLYYGVSTFSANIKGGAGEAIARYGSLFFLLATAGWLVSNSLNHVIAANSSDIVNGVLYSASSGISGLASLAASFGIVALAMAASYREEFNKIAAYVTVASGIVAAVFAIIATGDQSQAELAGQVGGICYIIWTLWAIMTGRVIIRKG